jgi:serine/threonine protein kinase
MAFVPGKKLGLYEIQSSLGAGGMGEVYRATDTKLGRDVALKVLPAEMAQNPERLGRFRREAKSLAQLDHPHRPATPDASSLGGGMVGGEGFPHLLSVVARSETFGRVQRSDALVLNAKQKPLYFAGRVKSNSSIGGRLM